jgi:hypothetical protein
MLLEMRTGAFIVSPIVSASQSPRKLLRGTRRSYQMNCTQAPCSWEEKARIPFVLICTHAACSLDRARLITRGPPCSKGKAVACCTPSGRLKLAASIIF